MAMQKYDLRRPEPEGSGFEVRHWSPVNSPVLDDLRRVRYIIHRVDDVTEFVRLRERGDEQEAITAELRTQAEGTEAEIVNRSQELQAADAEMRKAGRCSRSRTWSPTCAWWRRSSPAARASA